MHNRNRYWFQPVDQPAPNRGSGSHPDQCRDEPGQEQVEVIR